MSEEPLLTALPLVNPVPRPSKVTVTALQTAVGGVTSLTVTVKEHVDVLPDASVTRNVFVVTPEGNVEPLANPVVLMVEAPEQLSVPVGAVYVATAVQAGPAETVMFDGQMMVGNWVSFTVTVKEQVFEFEEPSVTR